MASNVLVLTVFPLYTSISFGCASLLVLYACPSGAPFAPHSHAWLPHRKIGMPCFFLVFQLLTVCFLYQLCSYSSSMLVQTPRRLVKVHLMKSGSKTVRRWVAKTRLVSHGLPAKNVGYTDGSLTPFKLSHIGPHGLLTSVMQLSPQQELVKLASQALTQQV